MGLTYFLFFSEGKLKAGYLGSIPPLYYLTILCLTQASIINT